MASVQIQTGFTSSDKETANPFNSYFTSIGNNLAAKFKYNDIDDVDHCKNKYTDKDTEDFKFDLITPDFNFCI